MGQRARGGDGWTRSHGALEEVDKEEEAGGQIAAACGHGGARIAEPDDENWRLKKMQLER
jgi:hypothetical protein